jgi:hypothetical protein
MPAATTSMIADAPRKNFFFIIELLLQFRAAAMPT